MRWMKTAVLSIACLTFAAGVSRAETNWVGIEGGLAVPTGDFGDAVDMGFDVGASGTWMFAPTWGVGVDVAYYMWNGKDLPPGVDFTANAIQATGHFKFMIPSESTIKPWLKGGLGMYNISGKLEGAGPVFDFDESEANFGFNIGGGINLQASPTMSYGIGAAYHSVAEGDTFDKTDFFTINVNLMFGVGAPQ